MDTDLRAISKIPKYGSFSKFSTMSDDEVLRLVRIGNADALDALISRYQSMVRTKANSFFLMGADKEDIIQEGMIGLYKATRSFRDDRNVTFRAFAGICVTRQMITAVKMATRQKHIPLNS